MHYEFALNFMKSFSEYNYGEQADLYFIFTSFEERDGFVKCNSIVLPKKLRIMKNKGIINIKKFYALMQLKDKYEYIIVIDDESQLISNVDLLGLCENFFRNKILYGNMVENAIWDFKTIVPNSCSAFFDKTSRSKLSCPLYLWFNQIPIYKSATLPDFFQMTNMGGNLSKLTYNDFDYYIYMFYLILKHGFTICDLGITTNKSMTEIDSTTRYKITNDSYKCANIFISTEYAKKALCLDKVFIIIHKDRDVASSKKKKNKLQYLCFVLFSYKKIKKILRMRG